MRYDTVKDCGRRWMTFSLRSLLLIVTAVAAFIGGRATMQPST